MTVLLAWILASVIFTPIIGAFIGRRPARIRRAPRAPILQLSWRLA